MKVLHINYSDSKGGASRAVLRIHESLLKKKVKSFLKVSINSKNYIHTKNILKPNFFIGFCNKIKSALESKISNILREDNFVKNSISLFPTFLHKKINRSNFDIVHLHWVNGETISIEDIGRIKKPIVWTLHDMWPFSGSEHITFNKFCKQSSLNNKKNKKKIIDFNISKFTWNRKIKNWKNKFYIVGVSKWITNCASQSHLMKKCPATTINNTLDIKFWKPENKHLCKKYFNLPENYKIIGFGSLEYKNSNLKGKDLFFSAINEIKYDIKKVIFLTIGDINNFCKNNKNLKIINIPKLENDIEIKKFYNCLDLIVVPSRVESFGQTAAEASACGIPVVCFNVTGLKDIIFHKINGWLANAYNPKKLAEGIDYILNLNKSKYDKMSLSGVLTVNKKFSNDLISSKYIKLYKKILNKKK